MMVRLDELPEPAALWRMDHWSGRRSSLWDGERALGSLEVEGFWGRRARYETARGTRTMTTSWLHDWRVVESQSAGSGRVIFGSGFMGRGRARFTDGREVAWRNVSFWGGVWAWRLGDEEIRFTPKGVFRRAFEVHWGPAARHWPELDALVGLGWWILLDSRGQGAH